MSRRELNIPGNGKKLTGLTSYSETAGKRAEGREGSVTGVERESTKSEGSGRQ